MIQKSKNKVLKYGITIRMIIWFVILVFVPYFFFIGVVFMGFRNHTVKSLSQTTEDAVVVVKSQIDSSMNRCQEATMSLYYGGYVDRLEDEAYQDEIEQALEDICFTSTDMLAAYIKTGDRILHGGGNYEELLSLMEPYEEDITDAEGKCIWYPTNMLHGAASETKYVLARSLNSADQENIGILYLVVDGSMVEEPYSLLTSEYSEKCLVDENGNIIYSTDTSLENGQIDISELSQTARKGYQQITWPQGKVVLVYSRLKKMGWISVSIIPVRDIIRDIRPLIGLFVLVSVIYVGFLLLILNMMRRQIFKPIEILKQTMDQYARNELDSVSAPVLGAGEIRGLSEHFNDMTYRITGLMKDYEEEVNEKNRQRMLTLTAQLTPHFIYNALNTIKWMAVLNRQDNIQRLTESLIYIFKNAAKVDDGNYTVGDELTLLENYAVIQKARFMNFDLVIEAEQDCLGLKLRKLLLQPVVENAIVHGLGRGKEKNSEIVVRVWREGETLYITIKDTGVGFDVEEWRRHPRVQKDHTNIGIHNIEEIIQLEYGEPYSMQIDSAPGAGTTVRYTLPAVMADSAETDYNTHLSKNK